MSFALMFVLDLIKVYDRVLRFKKIFFRFITTTGICAIAGLYFHTCTTGPSGWSIRTEESVPIKFCVIYIRPNPQNTPPG